MEENLAQLWLFSRWGFGICTTGFLFLAGWIWTLMQKLNKALTIHEDLVELISEVKDINGFLKGDFKEKGFITRHYDLEDKVEKMEKKIHVLEGKK